MSSLAANSVNVQILSDSTSKTVVKLTYFQKTAGDENSQLKVNVATLVGRTLILTTSNVDTPGAGFLPGEKLTQNSNSAIGHVLSYKSATAAANGSLTLVIDNDGFAITNSTTGNIVGAYGFSANVVAVTNPTYLLDIVSVRYAITPASNVAVALEFANSSAQTAAVVLSGSGYIGKNELPTSIHNKVASTDGNLYVSTAGIPVNGGYTLIVELRKSQGFAPGGNPVA